MTKVLWGAPGVHKLILWDTPDTQERLFWRRTGTTADPDMQHAGTGNSPQKNVRCRPLPPAPVYLIQIVHTLSLRTPELMQCE